VYFQFYFSLGFERSLPPPLSPTAKPGRLPHIFGRSSPFLEPVILFLVHPKDGCFPYRTSHGYSGPNPLASRSSLVLSLTAPMNERRRRTLRFPFCLKASYRTVFPFLSALSPSAVRPCSMLLFKFLAFSVSFPSGLAFDLLAYLVNRHDRRARPVRILSLIESVLHTLCAPSPQKQALYLFCFRSIRPLIMPFFPLQSGRASLAIAGLVCIPIYVRPCPQILTMGPSMCSRCSSWPPRRLPLEFWLPKFSLDIRFPNITSATSHPGPFGAMLTRRVFLDLRRQPLF